MGQDTGYSAPFVLQDILAQKRAVQHQKLVDSLNLVQQQASMEDQAKQRDIQQQQLKDNAAYRNEQIAEGGKDRASREKIAFAPARVQQPGIVEEYQYALKNGYKGDFSKYQTEDANRKRPTSPVPAFSYAGTDPDTGKPFSSNTRTGGFVTQDAKGGIIPYFGKAGAKPTTGGGDEPKPAEYINLSKLAKKATAGPARSFGLRAGKDPDPGDVTAYNSALNSIVTRTKAPAPVVEGVLHALEEDPSIPTAKIIADNRAANPTATPEELQQFENLLIRARGR